MPLASIRSPGHVAWRLGLFGALSVRAYALCVIAGIIVAVAVASRRYRRSGERPGVILDVAAWAIPFGLAGSGSARHPAGHQARLRPRVPAVARRRGGCRGHRRAGRGSARYGWRVDRLPPAPGCAWAGRGRGRTRCRVRAGRRRPGQLVGAAVLRLPTALLRNLPSTRHDATRTCGLRRIPLDLRRMEVRERK